MNALAIDEIEEVHLADIESPYTIMARSYCDMGPYKSINFIISTKHGETLYVVLGEKEKDFNTILIKTSKKKEAERKYYHVTSKYLFP